MLPASVLGPGLNDPTAFLHCADLFRTLLDRMGNGFFQINIFARLNCIHQHLFVPVVRRSDHNRVNILLVKQLAVIVKLCGSRADHRGSPVQVGLEHIGYRHHLGTRNAHGLELWETRPNFRGFRKQVPH